MSCLNLFFEDLDLIGANDPEMFFESVLIYNEGGDLIGGFSDIADPFAAGDAGEQQITSLALGELAPGSDYRLRLDLFSASDRVRRNTDEFVLAVISDSPVVSPIPLPAVARLMIGGLGGLAALRRFKA